MRPALGSAAGYDDAQTGTQSAARALASRHGQEAAMARGTMSKRKRGSKATAGKQQAVKSGNARRREQAKRMEEANTTQQGNRANVRQNTTRQGNRRSA